MYPTRTEPEFGSFVKEQADALRRLGAFVDVFSFDGRGDWNVYWHAALALRKVVAKGDFDVVHAHYGLSGAIALCQRLVPVVTTFHGSDSAQVPWQRWVSWVVARRCTPIFVSAANAERLGLSDALVLPAGVDTELFRPTDRAAARAALGWEPDHTYVLLPGRRSNTVKRADLFDRVVAVLRERVPKVRGVSLEGYSRDEVAIVMNAVDVVLLTSDYEGSPVAVKEALACMTPVVSVPAGDVPDVLAGLPGCAIAPRDPGPLADAVTAALTVRDEALRRRALEFSHDRVAARVLELYSSVRDEARVRSERRSQGALTPRPRPKRLCMVVHGPYPESRVAREAAAAIDAGYTVDVIATQEAGELTYEVVDDVEVRRLPVNHVHGAGIARILFEYLFFAAFASGLLAWRTVARRYDVVQVHNPPDFLIISALIPRLLGSRVVFDIHDRSPDMFGMRFPGLADRGASVVLRRIERLATALADAVVTVHEPYRRELVALGTPRDKATVIMNSLDERLIPPPKPRTREPFRIVYHGTITPHYGVHLLVDAVAETVRRGLDARLEIIGAGDSLSDVNRRIAALGIADRCTIEAQWIRHSTVLDRVNGASVGVVPNQPTPLNRFALSTKLFEYVALGVPVISAALPTIQEHFSSDEVVFFEPGDANSLAEALVEVARDPEAAEARAERARRRYDAYRWEPNARAYVAILDRLSAKSRDGVGVPRHGEQESSL